LLKKYCGFPACDSSDKIQAPKWQTQAKQSGICGRTIKARCTGSVCNNRKLFTFKIVDVCPEDRSHHSANGGDPDVAKDDYSCASKSSIDVDLDKSFHQENWASGNTLIEVGLSSSDSKSSFSPKKEEGSSGDSKSSKSSKNKKGSSSSYPTCKNDCKSDNDGDGWGWEKNESCRVK
jgi:hypothetical protein